MPFWPKLICCSTALLASATCLADRAVSSACHSATERAIPEYAPTQIPEADEVLIFSRHVDYQENQHLKLNGEVEILRGDVQVVSDQADINQLNQEAKLKGKVQVRAPELAVQGDSAVLNMESKETEVANAEFLSGITRIRGKAKRISVPNDHQLNIEDGFFTTCQPGQEAWSFAASTIELDQETGRGVAKHTRFQIYDVPVLYIPWFTFAIDDRRASGFLYPELGTSNTGDGLFISTPYYFNIAPHMDATLTPSSISGRGLHNELETRYLSAWGQSTLAVGYIDEDAHFVAEQAEQSKFNVGDRWGLNFRQDIQFDTDFGHWQGNINYSAVSDEDYLDDLNQGLQIENQDYLDRSAVFTLNYDTWRLKALVQEYAVLDDDKAPDDRPYQRLPELNFQLNEHIGKFNLHWLSDYVYFYRDQENLTPSEQGYGSRLHHRPSLALPLQTPWSYVTPRFTLDHTDYLLQNYAPQDNHVSRTIAISELDTGLYFDRYTRFFKTPLRHSLEPRAYYVYSDAKDQSALPNFDSDLPDFYFDRLFSAKRFSGSDRIADDNRYTLGFTSRWSDINHGRDLARFSMAYVHHLSDSRTFINTAQQVKKNDKQVAAELYISPNPNVDMNSAALWDNNREEMLETITQLSFHKEDYSTILNLAHRYRDGGFGEDGIEQADSSIIFPLNEKISILGRWRYEFNQHRTIGTLAGLEYSSCCWRLQVFGQHYLTDDNQIENGVLLRFQLIGLGSYGEDSSLLDDQIPGYAAREEYLH